MADSDELKFLLNLPLSIAECEACPPGMSCLEEAGTTTPSPCEPYHYCQSGVTQPIMCPKGTYTGK